VLKKIFSRREDEARIEEEREDSAIDLTYDAVVVIKPMKLRDITDVDSIVEEVRNGNILLIDIAPLAERNPEELQSAVKQIKTLLSTMGGELVAHQHKSDYPILLATPSFVKVWRSGRTRG